jgi:hypothetical protein
MRSNDLLLTNQSQQQQHVHLNAVTQAVVMELSATQMLQQIQTNRIQLFMSKLIQLMNELAPIGPQNKTLQEIRVIFQKRVQYVIEFGIANLFPLKLQPKKPKKPFQSTSTCVACDRPLLNEEDLRGEEQEEMTKDEHVYTKYLQLLQQEEQFLSHLEQQQQQYHTEEDLQLKKTPLSSFMTTKIDTKTSVKGKIGGHRIRPKTTTAASLLSNHTNNSNNHTINQEQIHYAPGNPPEYIYRGGFRLPKNTTTTMTMKTSSSSPQVGQVADLSTPNTSTTVEREGREEEGGAGEGGGGREGKGEQGGVDFSAIEKIPLVGKHQQQSTIIIPRPRTAPIHHKSLPRLSTTTTTTTT